MPHNASYHTKAGLYTLPNLLVFILFVISLAPIFYWLITHEKFWRHREWTKNQFRQYPVKASTVSIVLGLPLALSFVIGVTWVYRFKISPLVNKPAISSSQNGNSPSEPAPQNPQAIKPEITAPLASAMPHAPVPAMSNSHSGEAISSPTHTKEQANQPLPQKKPMSSAVTGGGKTHIGILSNTEITPSRGGDATLFNTLPGGETTVDIATGNRILPGPLVPADKPTMIPFGLPGGNIGSLYANNDACGVSTGFELQGTNRIAVVNSSLNDQKACNWKIFLFYADSHRTDIAEFLQTIETGMQNEWNNLPPEEAKSNRSAFNDIKRQFIQESVTEERFRWIVNFYRNQPAPIALIDITPLMPHPPLSR